MPAIIHIQTYGPDKINSIACQWQWKKTPFPKENLDDVIKDLFQ